MEIESSGVKDFMWIQLVNLSVPFEGLASNEGFQLKNKPPVFTGGYDSNLLACSLVNYI